MSKAESDSMTLMKFYLGLIEIAAVAQWIRALHSHAESWTELRRKKYGNDSSTASEMTITNG